VHFLHVMSCLTVDMSTCVCELEYTDDSISCVLVVVLMSKMGTATQHLCSYV
jgi:hypothetical protein